MSASQVTNPAIDPLREGLVMSLEVNLGKRGNILEVGPENASQVRSSYFLLFNYFTVFHFFFLSLLWCYHIFYVILSPLKLLVVLCIFHIINQVILSSPVLNEGELDSLLKDPILKPQILRTFFDVRKGVEGSLKKSLDKLCEAADEAVRNGSHLLVLSDRYDEQVYGLVLT